MECWVLNANERHLEGNESEIEDEDEFEDEYD
jgi:hypothetical protein